MSCGLGLDLGLSRSSASYLSTMDGGRERMGWPPKDSLLMLANAVGAKNGKTRTTSSIQQGAGTAKGS